MTKGRGKTQIVQRSHFSNKDMRRLFEAAIAAGWTAEFKGNGHVIVTSPDRQTRSILSTSRVGHRAYLNNRAALRRGGVHMD